MYRTNRGFKCADKTCYKKFSVTVGTIYENSKISLRIWFAAIYLCTSSKKGISSYTISRQLGVTQKTAWFVLHRIREMLREKAPIMLVDEVQIDETYIGGLEKNKHASKRNKNAQGRSDKKTPVFGLLQTNGAVVLHAAPIIARQHLEPIMVATVASDSTIVTDAFRVYHRLGQKYNHIIANHNCGVYVDAKEFHTNGIENFWSELKRGIYGIYHQVSAKHLQRYCDEFAARFNSRKIKDHERFEISVRNSGGRLKYNQLIGK